MLVCAAEMQIELSKFLKFAVGMKYHKQALSIPFKNCQELHCFGSL